MKISEIKSQLPKIDILQFQLPDGSFVPAHFHVTEVGIIHKHFIDCGGTVRSEKMANFQLWAATDHDHMLAPKKLLDIIELSEKVLKMENLEVEVEYQSGTIGKYGLEFNGENFLLTTKQTNCLAKEKCGVPQEKPKVKLSEMNKVTNSCCVPDSGCC